MSDKLMTHLVHIRYFKGKENFDEYLQFINTIRSNYEFSKKTYEESTSNNVMLIRNNKKIFGFVDAEIINSDLSDSRPMHIFVHELHLAPPMQKNGVGSQVIENLLAKGIDIEFVIANRNEAARALCKKFNHSIKYVTENTSTIRISAVR